MSPVLPKTGVSLNIAGVLRPLGQPSAVAVQGMLGKTAVDCSWPGLRDTRHSGVGFSEDALCYSLGW